MKKLSKIVVKDQAETLNKEEMKLILGGYGGYNSFTTYRCCCGMGQVSEENCIYFSGYSSDEAVYYLALTCTNGIGGCFLKN